MSRTRSLVGALVALALCAPACAEKTKDKAPEAASAEAQGEQFKRMTVDELSAKME